MNPFKPFPDATVALTVSSSSSRIAFNAEHNGSTARLMTVGADHIRFRFGDSSVVANENDTRLPPNWVEVFTVPSGATHCAAYALASPGDAVLEITPGDGE